MKLVTSRRFRTVEKRFKKACEEGHSPYKPIPADADVVTHFTACILQDRDRDHISLTSISESLAKEFHGLVFRYDEYQEHSLVEKEWPMGPTSSIGGVWPFIYTSTDGDYSEAPPKHGDRFFVAGVLAVYSAGRQPVIELPELTAAIGVLEEVSQFLPQTSVSYPTAAIASKFQFYLKSALPFGSPVLTSFDDLRQFNATSIATTDAALLNQAATGVSSQRIPSWKPFPILPVSGGSTSASLKLHVVEHVCFALSGKEVAKCTVAGQIVCDCDIPGTPEITLPLQCGLSRPSLTLHGCARLLSESTDKLMKISFVPLSSAFPVACYNYPSLSHSTAFPVEASFRLFQISPTQFRFRLTVRLKILFAQFHLAFSASTGPVKIVALPHTVHSNKTKVEIVNGIAVWTLRTPATFNPDGEEIDGVAETDGPLGPGDSIARQASVHFRMRDNHFSQLVVLKENISIFPNNARVATSVSYEMLSTQAGCVVHNSATPDAPSKSEVLDFNDCLVLS